VEEEEKKFNGEADTPGSDGYALHDLYFRYNAPHARKSQQCAVLYKGHERKNHDTNKTFLLLNEIRTPACSPKKQNFFKMSLFFSSADLHSVFFSAEKSSI
jgi:hypothetical protein